MSFASALAQEAAACRTGLLLAGLVVLALCARLLRTAPVRVLRGPGVLFAVHLASLVIAATLLRTGSGLHREAHLLALVLAAVVGVKTVQELLFSLLLPRTGVRTSRILSDVLTAAASLLAVFVLASRAGLNVSGLIATSAVLTAVVGFALKDTLGNVIGGLSLQTDRSIQPGDWVRVGDVEGRVVDIRWRYTAIETRNGETLIVPNGVLTNEKVLVLGRRVAGPVLWRRWLHFQVEFQRPPHEVVRVVTEALRAGAARPRRRRPSARLPLPRRAGEQRALRRALLADGPRERPADGQPGADARPRGAAARGHRARRPRAAGAADRAVAGAREPASPASSGPAAWRRSSRSACCVRWTRPTASSWRTTCATPPSRAARC